jgi:hypothetical protein
VVEEHLGEPTAAGAGGHEPGPLARDADGAGGHEPGPLARDADRAGAVDLKVRLWDPSAQLRYSPKRKVPPRPDGAPNATPRGWSEAEAHQKEDQPSTVLTVG